jgi:hypothetical protein
LNPNEPFFSEGKALAKPFMDNSFFFPSADVSISFYRNSIPNGSNIIEEEKISTMEGKW